MVLNRIKALYIQSLCSKNEITIQSFNTNKNLKKKIILMCSFVLYALKNDKRKKNLFFLYVGKVTACFNYVDDDDHHQRENEKRKRAFVHVSIFVLRLIEEKKRE